MDIKHYFIEKGQGEPLILLHGNGEDSSYFSRQIDFFSNKYRVIAVDTRGHGRTARGKEAFTIRQFAEDLLFFMDEHKIDKAHILGFSDGGNIAMIFAMNHPERVGKLILNGANLDTGGVDRIVQKSTEKEYKEALKNSAKSRKAAAEAEMLGLMVNDPNIDPKDLRKIQSPVLVIAGTEDVILKKHTEKIAGNINDSRLVFIEGDHFIALDKYSEFNKAVESFLEE